MTDEFAHIYAEAAIVRALQNSRALAKRQGLSEAMRAELPDLIALLASCLRDRGIDPKGIGWRRYPRHKGPAPFGISISFATTASGEVVAHVVGSDPPQQRRKRRKPAPAKVSGGDAMTELERQLASDISASPRAGTFDISATPSARKPADEVTDLERQLAASLKLVKPSSG